MRDVILLYEASCPNVSEARANLRRAFALANVRAAWREIDVNAADTPEDWRALGITHDPDRWQRCRRLV
jgi:hypothetical protein